MAYFEYDSLTAANVCQIYISFSCLYPVVDHKFRHNIVKVATTLTML